MPMPTPAVGLRRNAAAVATSRRFILRIHGANRNAVRVLDDLDKQFPVVIASSPDAFHTPRIPGSLARSDLPIRIDHFERLPGLQVPLPMKIPLRENRPLLALCPRRHTSPQQNHRHTNRPRYPAPYECLYLVHDFSLSNSCLFLEAACRPHSVRSPTHFGSQELCAPGRDVIESGHSSSAISPTQLSRLRFVS
jgi:hypothetical protein